MYYTVVVPAVYKHKNTSVSLLRYHFVFVPKRHQVPNPCPGDPRIGKEARKRVIRMLQMASPGKLRAAIEDKSTLYGTKIERVDPRGTSKTCPDCQSIALQRNPDNTGLCTNCGATVNNVDESAALEILRRMRALGCSSNPRGALAKPANQASTVAPAALATPLKRNLSGAEPADLCYRSQIGSQSGTTKPQRDPPVATVT